MEKPIIQIRNLGKEFKTANGPVRALNDINLNINQGEIFGIIGLSGAGKSTLVRCINYLEAPTEGEVLFEGQSLSAMSGAELRKARRSMGMIFQQFNLLAQRNVIQNVCFPLEIAGAPKKEARERAMELLGLVGLADRKDAYPSQLSGGQKQRVAIGSVIVRKPRAYLMDEPLSNLDAKLRSQMRVEIAKLHKQLGATMIYVTHDQVEAMTLGTRIVVMKEGAIQQVAPPAELYQNPVNRFVAGFIGSPAMNFLEGKVVLSNQGPCLKGNGWQLPLTLAQGKKLMDKGYMDKMVTLGIRAEDFHEQQWGEAWLEVLADVREMLGAEVLLHGRVCGDGGAARHGTAQGEPVRDSLNWENSPHICAKLPPSCCVKAGGRVRLYVDMGRIKLFDTITEENILYV